MAPTATLALTLTITAMPGSNPNPNPSANLNPNPNPDHEVIVRLAATGGGDQHAEWVVCVAALALSLLMSWVGTHSYSRATAQLHSYIALL